MAKHCIIDNQYVEYDHFDGDNLIADGMPILTRKQLAKLPHNHRNRILATAAAVFAYEHNNSRPARQILGPYSAIDNLIGRPKDARSAAEIHQETQVTMYVHQMIRLGIQVTKLKRQIKQLVAQIQMQLSFRTAIMPTPGFSAPTLSEKLAQADDPENTVIFSVGEIDRAIYHYGDYMVDKEHDYLLDAMMQARPGSVIFEREGYVSKRLYDRFAQAIDAKDYDGAEAIMKVGGLREHVLHHMREDLNLAYAPLLRLEQHDTPQADESFRKLSKYLNKEDTLKYQIIRNNGVKSSPRIPPHKILVSPRTPDLASRKKPGFVAKTTSSVSQSAQLPELGTEDQVIFQQFLAIIKPIAEVEQHLNPELLAHKLTLLSDQPAELIANLRDVAFIVDPAPFRANLTEAMEAIIFPKAQSWDVAAWKDVVSQHGAAALPLIAIADKIEAGARQLEHPKAVNELAIEDLYYLARPILYKGLAAEQRSMLPLGHKPGDKEVALLLRNQHQQQPESHSARLTDRLQHSSLGAKRH